MLTLVLFDILVYFLNVAASTSSDYYGIKLELATTSGRANKEQLPSNMDYRNGDFMFFNAPLHDFLDLLSLLSPELDGRILEEFCTFLLKLFMVKILKHLLEDPDLRVWFTSGI